MRDLAAVGAIRAAQDAAAVSADAVLLFADFLASGRFDRSRDHAAGENVSRCFPMSFHGRESITSTSRKSLVQRRERTGRKSIPIFPTAAESKMRDGLPMYTMFRTRSSGFLGCHRSRCA